MRMVSQKEARILRENALVPVVGTRRPLREPDLRDDAPSVWGATGPWCLRVRPAPSREAEAVRLRLAANVKTVRQRVRCRACGEFIADGSKVFAFYVGLNLFSDAYIHAEDCGKRGKAP